MDELNLVQLTNFRARPSFAAVKTITTHDAKTHLSRYLAAVEAGEEFVIARGRRPVALLSPLQRPDRGVRPRVGRLITAPFRVPREALAPLTDRELKDWGL